ncbi:fimbrial protein [[Enterobacter] lignolyticus]|uniref:Fimbrial protein domain-containing protein n=1 Tax=Enterobacter lignolyticus (strain SCF1) TaxID=701347 RepID=E3GA60_ENTLS|nr:fimbrial protein [[Enterobacter] lignolyticus]ADO46507.1 Fimbrial protein domain-containing protein [[Enterobacter] lignolyticus SCF1]
MTSSMRNICLLIAAGVISSSAFAAPTVTFQGEVTDQTCSVTINGQSNSIVMLPTVAMTDFGATLANGQVAGLTPFTVSLTGCTASGSPQNISTKFLGYNVDATSGVMGNRAATNAASGFGIQLTDSGTGGSPVMLNGPTNVAGLVLPAGATSTSYDFGAQYYVIDSSTAAPGAVTAVAEYTVSYF